MSGVLLHGPRLPAQTHWALKNALRRGGKLRPTCEVRQGKRALVARVGAVREVFLVSQNPLAK